MAAGPRASDVSTRFRMTRQGQRDTQPERQVRRALSMLGVRYRIAPPALPGKPDIANASRRWVIFVHGCYWHHHAGCRRATLPKRNRDWWKAKFEANRERDERKIAALEELGFRVLVLWECETGNQNQLLERLRAWAPLLANDADHC